MQQNHSRSLPRRDVVQTNIAEIGIGMFERHLYPPSAGAVFCPWKQARGQFRFSQLKDGASSRFGCVFFFPYQLEFNADYSGL
jgi:hypothetical protein